MSNDNRRLRHEHKYIITRAHAEAVKARLKAVARPDKNAIITENEKKALNPNYRVTSLYFENIYRTAYNDKLAGIAQRNKFRIRAYNLNPDTLRLEAKHKNDDYIYKTQSSLTYERYEALLKGEMFSLDVCNSETSEDLSALQELALSYNLTRPRPSVLVDYIREAFVYPQGNVRITLDYNLSTSYNSLDMFKARFSSVLDGVILEIKYDAFIPAHIAELFHDFGLHRTAVSKFVLCSDKLLEVKKQCVY